MHTHTRKDDRITDVTTLFSPQEIPKAAKTSKPSVLNKVGQFFSRLFSSKEKVVREAHPSLEDRVVDKRKPSALRELQLDDGCPSSSVFFNEKTKQYTYVCPAPPIKNVVISGGGAKGIILPGVIKAFETHKVNEDTTFRQQLDNIAGSSVGAITAGLVAAGLPADAIISATKSTVFKDLLGKGRITKTGEPLLDFIRNSVNDGIRHNLKSILKNNASTLERKVRHELKKLGRECSDAEIQKMVDDLKNDLSINLERKVRGHLKKSGKSYPENEISKIITDLKAVLKIINGTTKSTITFSMLRSLHKLDSKAFKDLTVTATCCEKGKVFYFDADKTPNLDVAVACRASASLPVVLEPVKINRKELSPGYADIMPTGPHLTFIDGGYLDNTPVTVMQNKQNNPTGDGEQGQNLQTLVLAFDKPLKDKNGQSPFLEAKPQEHPLYDSSNYVDRFLCDIFAKKVVKISTNERNTLTHEEGVNKIRAEYTQRTIPLPLDIQSKDFVKAKQQEERFIKEGEKHAEEYLELHRKEAVAHTFDDFLTLREHVPAEHRKKLDKFNLKLERERKRKALSQH